MEVGTAEGRIDVTDVDSLLESSIVSSNEPAAQIEETPMTEPEDLEEKVEEKKRGKKMAGRPRITSAKKPAMKTKAKTATNGDAKASLAIDEGTKRLVRKLRAKMELENGERISFAETITFAVEQALK
jgi:16S rRNA U516 pseudouridylate synthase RsuA-like enzyme